MKIKAIINEKGLSLGKIYDAMAVGAGSNYGYKFIVFNDDGQWVAYNLFAFVPYDMVEEFDLKKGR